MVIVELLLHRPRSMPSLFIYVRADIIARLSCGDPQTMNHTVDYHLLTKFEGGLITLHEAEEDAVNWLIFVAAAALKK